jgi:hypothetical protein
MEGSRTNPVKRPEGRHRADKYAACVLAAGACVAMALAAPARAADATPTPLAVGQPTALFSPGSTGEAAAPSHQAAAPAKRATAATHPTPVKTQPLIPPVAAPKLGPPPDPRPALSLETDLQPLVPPAPQPPPANAAAPPAVKRPAG